MQTGTLTSDEMILRGVRLDKGDGDGAGKIICTDGTKMGNNDDLILPKTESSVTDILDGNVGEGSGGAPTVIRKFRWKLFV